MKLDPRAKMVMALCLSGLALVYNSPLHLLLLLAVTVALLLSFRFELSAIGSYLKPFLSLMLFLFLIQCLFSPSGRVLLAVGTLPLVTTGGLLTGAGVVLRIVVVTAAAMLLAFVALCLVTAFSGIGFAAEPTPPGSVQIFR